MPPEGWDYTGDLDENSIIYGTGASNHTSLLWVSTPNGSLSFDGAFYAPLIPIDKTKTYIHGCFVKRLNDNGATYLGTNRSNSDQVAYLDDEVPTYPYTISNQDLPLDNTWYLLVGIVHPYGYSGADTGISGIYSLDGARVYDGTELKRLVTATHDVIFYGHYNDSVNTVPAAWCEKPFLIQTETPADVITYPN